MQGQQGDEESGAKRVYRAGKSVIEGHSRHRLALQVHKGRNDSPVTEKRDTQ